ncbi:LIG4, partial [Symbiodinium microadriaticum]
QCIRAASFSFAAIRGDGSVVTWGDHRGGDSSHVQSELHDVCEIQATFFAFAAIRADRSVVTWGQAASGGDCSAVRDQLHDVQEIQSNAFAFAALRADGSVVTWGEDWMGGDSSSVRSELQDVLRIYSRRHSGMFAAIKTRGRIVFWGNAAHFGEINTGLPNIAHFIYAGGRWAAASEEGSLALSFRSIDGERCMQVPDCALKLVHCMDCIAILQKNGEVLFWGRAVPGWLRNELKNVAQLRVTRNASECAAIRSDGSVVTWRFRSTGVHAGARRAVRSQLRNVRHLQRNDCGFAALREDGSVVTWGIGRFGGSSSIVRTQLKDVVCIQANNLAFAAVRCDGSVVSWGWSHAGGDSRHVREELGRANAAPKRKPAPKPAGKKTPTPTAGRPILG